jgi:hypothetical protein
MTLMGWVVVRVATIGHVSLMQPASFVAGAAIAALTGTQLRAGRRPAQPNAA